MKKIIKLIAILLCSFILFGCSSNNTPVYKGVSLVNDEALVKNSNKQNDLPILAVSSDAKYFVRAKELVKVQIELDNPMNFEILSLTINERKYQSFEFLKGSTSNLIIIEKEAPENPGEYTYTIDNMKYVDGTSIKLVDMTKAPKTIKFGVRYSVMPTATISNHKYDYDSYEADLKIDDPQQTLSVGKALIYLLDNNREIVAKQEISEKIKFTNLNPGINYKVLVVLSMDILDGSGAKTYILEEDSFSTKSALHLFVSEVHENYANYALFIFEDEVEILSFKLIGENCNRDIDWDSVDSTIYNLEKGQKYSLVLKYKFNNKNYEYKENFVALEEGNKEYKITDFEIGVSEMAVNYRFNYSVHSGVKSIYTFLYLDGQVIDEDKDNNCKFAGLYANRNYELEVVVSYLLPDINGNTYCSIRKSFTTKKVEEPFLQPIDLTLDNGRLCGNLEFTSPLSQVILKEVMLYRDGKLVGTSSKLDFNNVDNIDNYVIKINISYDLRDGSGRKDKTFVIEKESEIAITVADFKLMEPNKLIKLGDDILISLNLNTPEDISYSYIAINGREYKVLKQTGKTIEIRIINDGLGGLTSFNIDYLVGNYFNETKKITKINNQSQEVFINGDLEILNLELVNDKLEPIEKIKDGDLANILVSLNNKTGYEISELILKNNYALDLIKISTNEYLFKCDLMADELIWLESLKLKANNLEEALALDYPAFIYVAFEKANAHHITKASDLANLGSYNILDNDLDLTNVDYSLLKNNSLTGILDGNGHTISNLKINLEGGTEDIDVGLFNHVRGEIKNLNIKGFDFKINFDSKNTKTLHVGLIAGKASDFIKFDNVHISDSVLEVKASRRSISMAAGFVANVAGGIEIRNSSNGANIYAAYAAGLVYDVYGDALITDSYNTGHIGTKTIEESKGDNGCAAGLIKIATNITIKRSYNTGNIIGNSNVGGLIAVSTNARISECYNSGRITALDSAGGLIYRVSNSLLIRNSYNSGAIKAATIVAGLAGEANRKTVIQNSYNSGKISAGYIGAGITVNFMGNSKDRLVIMNTINIGEFEALNYWTLIGSIVESFRDTNIIEAILDNIYSLNQEGVKQLNIQGNSLNKEEINQKLFKENLFFSEDIWNLNDANYPSLKSIK